MHCSCCFLLQLSQLFLLQLFFILGQEFLSYRADVMSMVNHCILLMLDSFECLQTSILVKPALILDAIHFCLLHRLFKSLFIFNTLSCDISKIWVFVSLRYLILQSIFFLHQFAHSVFYHLFLFWLKGVGLPQFAFAWASVLCGTCCCHRLMWLSCSFSFRRSYRIEAFQIRSNGSSLVSA